MSEEKTDSEPMTNRLLVLAGVIALAAAAAVYYFYGRHEAALQDVQEAKRHYEEMKNMGPEVVRLLDVESQMNQGDIRTDPTTYLGQAFTKAGFDRQRFTVARVRENTLADWVEKPYRVDFPRKTEDPIDRSQLVTLLARIEAERPDLKTKDIEMHFKDAELERVVVTFARYERAEP